MNNNNEIKSLIVKRENIIIRLKNRLIELFNLNDKKQKNNVENKRRPLNLKTLVMSYPEFKGMTEEEIYNLIDEKDKEYEERRKFEKENGKTFDEFINETNERLNCISLNDTYEEEYDFENIENNNSSRKFDSMITDKNSYDLVMEKLKSGEITDDQLSISDLLKINLMLKSEIDIKMDKFDIENKMKFDNEVEQLEREITELENIINKKS